MTGSRLECAGYDVVNFRDRTYRWVDVKHFRLSSVATEREALHSFCSTTATATPT